MSKRGRIVGHAVQSGFTLIEVLVSLLILSVLSATAWKGMDAITQARDIADGKLKQTLRLQSVMTQWEADLSAVIDTGMVPAWQFDGANVRMTRKTGAGVQMVVWSLRKGQWSRWASEPGAIMGDLQQAWMRSFQLQGTDAGTLQAMKGVDQWQVYCHRGSAWSNCQSSNDMAQRQPTPGAPPSPPAKEMLPGAIRLVLTLSADSGFTGPITRDVLMPPQPNQ
jgi:general secretion pathway protein J